VFDALLLLSIGAALVYVVSQALRGRVSGRWAVVVVAGILTIVVGVIFIAGALLLSAFI
jgi:hypothetical protein